MDFFDTSNLLLLYNPHLLKIFIYHLQTSFKVLSSLYMYYHNSPTVQKIKQLKASRAADMADATAGMKQISASYKKILTSLEILREKEIKADDLIRLYPDKAGEVRKKMRHYYKLIDNKLEKFLSDTNV